MKLSIKKIIMILVLLVATGVGSTVLYANYMKNKDVIKTELYPIEQEFLVNLKSKDSDKRILKASITLEITGKKSQETLTENSSKVRDVIITTISTKTENQLTVDKRDELKSDLTKNLNKILGDKIVVDIFFQDFLIS